MMAIAEQHLEGNYTLTIVEGPAGCGKSTAIASVLKYSGYYEPMGKDLITISRPRNYGDSIEGALLSQMRDTTTLMGYMGNIAVGKPRTIADRLGLSFLVYEAIRSDSHHIDSQRVDDVIFGIQQSWDNIFQEFVIRTSLLSDDNRIYRININWVVVLPELDYLIVRREQAHKTDERIFPFDPFWESDLYSQVYHQLVTCLSRNRWKSSFRWDAMAVSPTIKDLDPKRPTSLFATLAHLPVITG